MAGGFQDLLDELFAPLGGVSIRRMFGGLGAFKDAIMFAIVASDVLYFKADEQTTAAFEKEGCGPWIYHRQGKAMETSYWRVPERLLDEPDEFADWAREAFAVALRTQKAKGAKKPKPAPKAKAAKSTKPVAKKKLAKRR